MAAPLMAEGSAGSVVSEAVNPGLVSLPLPAVGTPQAAVGPETVTVADA
jgi:hypothetical protein